MFEHGVFRPFSSMINIQTLIDLDYPSIEDLRLGLSQEKYLVIMSGNTIL